MTIKASDTLEHQPTVWQNLTHAHSHITLAVVAMDRCFGLAFIVVLLFSIQLKSNREEFQICFLIITTIIKKMFEKAEPLIIRQSFCLADMIGNQLFSA